MDNMELLSHLGSTVVFGQIFSITKMIHCGMYYYMLHVEVKFINYEYVRIST